MAGGASGGSWKPGQSGNPAGALREKKFLAALNRAIVQDKADRLRLAAEKLLTLASEGEPWAIQQLADRLDGKPTQQMDMRVTKPLKELSDAELAEIASGSGDGVAGAETSPQEPTQLH